MLKKANRAAGAVESAADAVNGLATDTRAVLSDVKEQVSTSVTFLPAAIIGVGIVAVVALVVSLVAVSRNG